MAKKSEEKPKTVCPCWAGHWIEKTPPGSPAPQFALKCDYCGREFKTRSAGPYDAEKGGVPVGKHWEQESEPT